VARRCDGFFVAVSKKYCRGRTTSRVAFMRSPTSVTRVDRGCPRGVLPRKTPVHFGWKRGCDNHQQGKSKPSHSFRRRESAQLDVRILPACAIPSILVILAHPMASDLSVRVEKAAGGDPTFRSPSRAGSRGARQQAYGTHFGASTSSMPLLDGVTVSPLDQRADRHAGGAPLPGTVGAASATRTSRLMHARIALAQQKKEFSRMNVSNLREAGAVSRAGRYAYPMV
jgi:hypothetical protein